MTRVARMSETTTTTPLGATRRPVTGPGAALSALVRTPAASTATVTRSQNERRARCEAGGRAAAGWHGGSWSHPQVLLGRVALKSAVRAAMTSNTTSATLITTGRRRQRRLGLRSTNGKMASRAKKTSSP